MTEVVRWRRAVVPVLAVLGAGLVVLATWSAPSERRGEPSANLQVGTCHLLLDSSELSLHWDVRPPVPCDEAHVGETIVVRRLPPTLARRATAPSHEVLQRLAPSLCLGVDVAAYVGADEAEPFWFIDVQPRVPTPDAWARGERRYRCDLVPALLDDAGRPLRVGSLRGLMSRPESAAIRRCVLSSKITPCARPHTAEVVGAPGATSATDGSAACELLATRHVGAEPGSLGLVAYVDRQIGSGGGSEGGTCIVAWSDLRTTEGTVAARAAAS